MHQQNEHKNTTASNSDKNLRTREFEDSMTALLYCMFSDEGSGFPLHRNLIVSYLTYCALLGKRTEKPTS